MSEILLDNLTEYQKSLLTRLSYLDIDFNKFQELKNQTKITISDLKFLILNPNKTYLGDLHISKSTKLVTGVSTTNLEFIEKLEAAELGDLQIVDFADDEKSGFQGICFRDSKQNTGFSFRGTDVKTISSLAKDSLTDVEAFLTNNTEQINQAQLLFQKYQNSNGQNFLYGHSLGGFLAENIYLQNHENIANAFVINPLHINSQLLNTQIKINAFNNSNKFNCFVTGGDYVSSINAPNLFKNNIQYVQNNKQNVNNLIGNHLIEAGQLDENGNFVTCSKEEAFKGHTMPLATTAISIINNNKIKSFFGKAYLSAKDWVISMKNRLAKLFKKEKAPKNLTRKTNTFKDNSNFEENLKPQNYIGKNYTEKDWEKAKEAINNSKSLTPPLSQIFPQKEKEH